MASAPQRGQDALKVYAICLKAAERAGGVPLPPVYVGYETLRHGDYPFTLEFSGDLVERLALEREMRFHL